MNQNDKLENQGCFEHPIHLYKKSSSPPSERAAGASVPSLFERLAQGFFEL